jgi:UDP-MurNAc hydroxylase
LIRVTYYYSACVGLWTPDLSILCDPWFSEGIYDGAWYAFPRLENPLERIGSYDTIYLSHIHPDHYDPDFLRTYRSRFPKASIVIGDRQPNYLSRKLHADGFEHQSVRTRQIGDSEIGIFPNRIGSAPVDTALVVKHGGHAVVNMNDNPYDPEQLDAIRHFAGSAEIRIALLPYAGAGPYPQTYYTDSKTLASKAAEKKQDFFERYEGLRSALGARVNIPFAGQYILGGKLAALNRHRGVSDAAEILGRDSTAVVLADGGDAQIDTASLQPSRARTVPYPTEEMERAIAAIADRPLAYESHFADLPTKAIPFSRLLPAAYEHAVTRSSAEHSYIFAIRAGDRWFVCDACKKDAFCEFRSEPPTEEPRSEIEIDARYLFGLVTGVYHWNNAEVGSLFRVRRVPDRYDPDAQNFLNFFHL